MRRSPLRHNLAQLRLSLNLGQKQMADLAGCSTRAIQSVELGTLTLSEGLARRISAATGVHLHWLLDNDLEAPIVNRRGHPYSRVTFDHRQAAKAWSDNELSRQSLADYSANFYGQIRAILSSASKKDLAEVATWRLGKFLDACRREFGHDKRLIEMDDSPYPNDRQVEASIKLFQQYDRERTVSIRQTMKVSKEDEARFVTYMRSMFAMLDKKPAAKKRTTERQSRRKR